MGVWNPIGPFARVTVSNRTGHEWIFGIGPWPSTNEPGRAQNMGGPFVTSVSVSVTRGGVHDGITLGIQAPYAEGINLIEQGAFDFMNSVTVQLGYQAGAATQVTDEFFGFLNEGGEGLSLTAEGLSGSIVARYESRQTDYVVKGAAGATKTAAQLLSEHAQAMGLLPVALGGGAALVEALSKADKSGKAVLWGVESSVGHMQIVRKILSLAGVDWHLGNASEAAGPDGTPTPPQPALFYYEKDYAAKMDPVLHLVLRGGLDPTASPPLYPIIEASVSGGAAMWQEGRRWMVPPEAASAGVTVAAMDKDSGAMEYLWLPPEKSARPNSPGDTQIAATAVDDRRNTVQADAAVDGVRSTGRLLVQGVPSGADAKALVEARAKQALSNAADSFALTLTVTTLGIPAVYPAQPVRVSGCSRMYDSTYAIMKVTHNYAPGDWKTVLEMVRWGTTQKANLQQTVSDAAEMKPGQEAS